MRERRRPLAALAASGVPTGALARSLLWQNAVPVLLAVVVAVVTGIGLAQLVFRMVGDPFTMDWLGVALYSGAATVLVLLVTAMTLPTLRSATRLAALRTE
jgi:CubicO group peptidase (beta-lactamase class C family)